MQGRDEAVLSAESIRTRGAQDQRGPLSERRPRRQRKVRGRSTGLVEADRLLICHLEYRTWGGLGLPHPRLHLTQRCPHDGLGRSEHPLSDRRHPDQGQSTPRGLSQRLDGGSKGISIYSSDLDAGSQDAVAMMQRRDGLTAAATDRYRLVTTRDACILVELHDTHRDGVRCLRNRPSDPTLDAIHDSRPHHIIRVVLDGVKMRDVRKLTGCHAAMKAEANDDRSPVRQALIQRSQRGNKVEASGSVRDADGGAVE